MWQYNTLGNSIYQPACHIYVISFCNCSLQKLWTYHSTKHVTAYISVVVTSSIWKVINVAKNVYVMFHQFLIVLLKSHFLNRFGDVIKYCLRWDIAHAHESKRRYAIKLSVKCLSTRTRHSPLTFWPVTLACDILISNHMF